MAHKIQIFSGGCSLCKSAAEIVEVGKCKDCEIKILWVDSPQGSRLARKYGITAVPSIVIDGRIKVVGRPTFPWFCGDEFYRMLERKYPLAESKNDGEE